MSFKRQISPARELSDRTLDRAMAGIGMRFAVKPSTVLAIEDVLLFASQLGIEQEDYRVLSVLCQWIEVHAAHINVDRLTRLVTECADHPRTKSFWAAVGQWQEQDRRFARLAKLRPKKKRIDLFKTGTDFQIKRRGEHPWFKGTCLRVPAGTLRSRTTDVATPAELAKLHPGYLERVIQGPSYRADMWAALSNDPSLSPTALARATYGSFATAWEVKHDWAIVHPM